MKITRLPNRDIAPLVPELGSKIRSARQECGLSQVELARLIGFQSGVSVSLYESNKREVDAVTLWKIAQVTNVPITYFL